VYGIHDEPPAVRSARLGEQLAILEQLFTGESFDHDGRFYQMKNAQQRPRPLNGRIPILIGGAGPKLTMPLVARYADWWNAPSTDVHRVDEMRGTCRQRPRLDAACDRPGRYERGTTGRRRLSPASGSATGVVVIIGTPDQVADQLIAVGRSGRRALLRTVQ